MIANITVSCGDGVCGSGETCSNCPSDCGGCGGGFYVCTPNWTCTDWSTCSPEGKQMRTCTDLNRCGTIKNKPAEIQNCTYIEPTYCGDGICQANENCSDCPKDCGACPPVVVCGNRICEVGENYTNCPADCPAPPPTIPLGVGISVLVIILGIICFVIFRMKKIKLQKDEFN